MLLYHSKIIKEFHMTFSKPWIACSYHLTTDPSHLVLFLGHGKRKFQPDEAKHEKLHVLEERNHRGTEAWKQKPTKTNYESSAQWNRVRCRMFVQTSQTRIDEVAHKFSLARGASVVPEKRVAVVGRAKVKNRQTLVRLARSEGESIVGPPQHENV